MHDIVFVAVPLAAILSRIRKFAEQIASSGWLTFFVVCLAVVLLIDLSDWLFSFHRNTTLFFDHWQGRAFGDIVLIVVLTVLLRWPRARQSSSREEY